MAKKNCTCSQLQETIDKIFIDDSCCCQSTTVTPTDNCCSCEPVIDLIDTDKFACASFGNDRNLKYRIVREDWLTGGTNSKEVYDVIIESQASGAMMLIKVIRNDINENSKNYVLPPLEVSQDVESGVYFIRYFKLIEGNLHLCTYTIRQIDNDGIISYETSWESKAIDDFDISQYYNKTDIDNKFVTITYLTNNYYTGDTIDADFYRRSMLYRKDEIDDMFARKVLWEKGNGNLSTQRIGARCNASGAWSFVTGLDNSGNSNGTTVTGTNNTVTGDYSTATGHDNTINGRSNLVAGEENQLEANYSIAAGQNNTINGDFSEAFGYNNTISSNLSATFGSKNQIIGEVDAQGNKNGAYSFATGNRNTIKDNCSLAAGSSNIVKGHNSAALGINNVVNKGNSFAIGNGNTTNGYYSLALNEQSRSNGMASISGGRRSYTYRTGSCAIGTPVNIHYYAKLVAPNASETDTDYGYLVLTNINGNPVNIGQNSIQAKRFTFVAEDKFYGELTLELTEAERASTEHTTRFELNAIWPQLEDVKFVQDPYNNNKYLYFKPNSTNNVIWLFKNIIPDTSDWGSGVRAIGYASGFDGCKAIEIGAHAEGYGTMAKGIGSHSEGINTYTQNESEHACGKYNYSDNNTLFSIGIGKQEYSADEDGTDITIHRKNALEITTDNKIYLRIKEGNNENLYDLGKMLNLLIDNVLTSEQIDSLKVQNRETSTQNTDGVVPLSIKEY